jgi:26S proteasome regulatory subunit N1
MLSTTASLGLLLLWSPDVGLSQIDKYTYSAEEHIKAGALLATGLLHTNITSDIDAPLALLGDVLPNKSKELKTSAIIGLGLAYVGSCREELLGMLLPIITGEDGDGEAPDIELASLAALALGLIFVSSANGDISDTILQTLLERAEAYTSATTQAEKDAAGLDNKFAKFLILGLGLLYLGMQDASSVTVETLKVVEAQHSIGKNAGVVVEMCSFAGTGNVLRIQKMLGLCGADAITAAKQEEEKKLKEKEKEKKEREEAEKKDGEGDVVMDSADEKPAAAAGSSGSGSAASGSGGASSSSNAATTSTSTSTSNNKEEEKKEEIKVDESFQAFATLGIALIAIGEEVGAEMSLRQFNHLVSVSPNFLNHLY